ncbi:MAG: hypothetical protein QF460_01885, partial [Candidatus Nanoarchaeia archaeon]|nr:hypothetical protein [Candidatus Nanoarchaeia archaeon]
LDKRVAELSDSQANSLEPIFEILDNDNTEKYTLTDGKEIYHIQISKPFSGTEEKTLINAYLENKSDENYRTIMEEALNEVLKRNSQSIGLHFMMDEPSHALYFLKRNLKIRRLLKE